MRTLIESIGDDELYVLGDSAYGGFKKIIVAATSNANLLTSYEEFRYSQQRIVVENAFGRLKGKFKRLESRLINGHSTKSINSIKAIMWIHNFIINND
jgi:hypothetical protein